MGSTTFSARYTARWPSVAGAARSRPVCWVGSPTTSAATAARPVTARARAGAGLWKVLR
jgi:hypothetical protein